MAGVGATSVGVADVDMAASGAIEILPSLLEAEGAGTGTFPAPRTLPKILCCMCGISMDANPANMCVACLRARVDITEGIPKQIVMHQCRGCARYLRPPWVACELESHQLLSICLKKIPGLTKVRLVDAGFIWTEPHSRRLQVKLTIQKEVLNGVRLQQAFAVEFVIQNQQCDACQRSFTDHTWRAMVQVRQRVGHKKTFFLLEQLILKHGAHAKCINIEQVENGIDFSFSERSHARQFLEFLRSVAPIRSKIAKELISEDTQNGTANYKFSFATEIVPLCKDDLVVLPARTAAALGHINPLVLVHRVSNHIFFVDPRSLQMAEMDGEKFWTDPFRPLMSQGQLIEFIVIDVTPVTVAPVTGTALRRKQKGKRATATVLAAATRAAEARDRSTDVRLLAAGGSGGVGGSGSVAGGSASPSKRAAAAEAEAAVGDKRRRGAAAGGEWDASSTVGASSARGGGASTAGGFTGAVSLAGGSVKFQSGTTMVSTVTGGPRGKFLLADAVVMKANDTSGEGTRYVVRTHMGNILRSGDRVLGYDCTNAVYNDDDAESAAIGGRSRTKGTAGRAGRYEMPDVVLVRKTYRRRDDDDDLDETAADSLAARHRAAAAAVAAAGPVDGEVEMAGAGAGAGAGGPAARAPRRQRIWKLKRFEDDVPVTTSEVLRKGDAERREADFEAFLREIEDDPALRRSLNLYKDAEAIAARRAGGARSGGDADGATAASTAVAAVRDAMARFAAKAAARGAGAAAPAAAAAAAGAGAGGGGEDGGEDDEDEDGEGVPDISLDELLDEMAAGLSLGPRTTSSGGSSAGASSSASGGGVGAADAGAGGAGDDAGEAAVPAGAYVDPADVRALATTKARAKRIATLLSAAATAAASGDGGDSDDSDGAAGTEPAAKKRAVRGPRGGRSGDFALAPSLLASAPLAAVAERRVKGAAGAGDGDASDGDSL